MNNFMRKIIVILFFGILALNSSCVQNRESDGVIAKFHENVVWTTPSKNASESMPLGGGDIGCNIWVEEGDLLIYLQRSGSFSELGEYIKLGRIRISMSHNPFENMETFKQEHNLEDGNISIETVKDGIVTKLLLWVDIFNRSLHIKTETTKSTEMIASYESWRTADRQLIDSGGYGERFGCFQFENCPEITIKQKDSIEYVDNSVLFFHRNKDKPESPHLMITTQGLSKYRSEIPDYNSKRTSGGFMWGDNFKKGKESDGIYNLTPYKSWSIESKSKEKEHKIVVSTHIRQTETLEEWLVQLDSIQRIDSKTEGRLSDNTKWWNEFWDRSWIIVDPYKRERDSLLWTMGRNYQLFRYQLGCNMYGDYPSKFNGGSFTFDPSYINKAKSYDPDWRQWGGDVFTMQNQRLLYWPMLKSGDFEGMHSEFRLFTKSLEGAKIKAKEYFGHKGAMFTEYVHPSGVDLTSAWGWSKDTGAKGGRTRGEEIPFGDPRANAMHTYGGLVEKGLIANGSIAYHWEAQVEHAYMVLEWHRYTGESITEYMPFIKESLLFFDEHYKLREKMRNNRELDENGKLVFYPSTSCESYRGAKNPTDLISGLSATLEYLLKLDATYLTEEERDYFKGYLSRMPDISFGVEKGDSIVLPAESYLRYQNVECPQFYPLFPFNRFDIESNQIPIFRNTWKHGKFAKNMVISWHQDGIFFARMGMVEEAMAYNQRKLKDSPRRFPSFWGPGHDWAPDHNWGGTGMLGLQEMLMQTVGETIHILPAWPKNKDVCFKLHAPQNTTIEVEYINGVLKKLNVQPEQRKKDVKVMLK